MSLIYITKYTKQKQFGVTSRYSQIEKLKHD